MKNLIKRFFGIIAFFLFYSSFIYSQPIEYGEFMIVNRSNTNQITVKIYPNGAIFNGDYEYNLYAANPVSGQEYIYPKGPNPITLDPFNTGTYFKKGNFDRNQYNENCDFSLGYGIYRVEITEGANTVWIEVDFSDANFGNGTSNYYQKLRVDYHSSIFMTFNFIDYNGNNFNTVPINSEDRINVWDQEGVTPHQSFTPNKGDFADATISEFHNWPLIATGQYQALGHLNPEEVYLNLKVSNHNLNINADDKIIKFENCIFKINDGMTVTIDGGSNENPEMLISGYEAKLISNENSTINFPYNFKLRIYGLAAIESNTTTFTSNSSPWYGLELEYPGNSFINHCTFNNAKMPISSFWNDNRTLSITNGNTFQNTAGQYCFYASNTNNLYISGNYFLINNNCAYKAGIFIQRSASSEEENNNAPWDSRKIIISGNVFEGGYQQIMIEGVANDIIYPYIIGNTFNGGASNIYYSKFVSGRIYGNYIQTDCQEMSSINLYENSKPDFYGNVISSERNNILAVDGSTANLAPYPLGNNQYLWTGGKNNFTSLSWRNILLFKDDIHTIYPNLNVDYGKNIFTIRGQMQHIFGYINTVEQTYYARCNTWAGYNGTTNPYIFLLNLYNNQMNVEWNSGDCSYDEQIVDRIINNLGNGIYDTILITQSNNNPPPDNDALLYGIGIKNQSLQNYSFAISNLKSLINTYSNSKYLSNSFCKLYECYDQSDTNHTQSWRNIIFGEFKNYLSDKIVQYENNDEIVNLAYDFFLKCYIKLKNYYFAMDGYEFIANNSPSALERLYASLSYIVVEGLIVGQGGGVKENNENNPENIKPIKEILLNSYAKSTKTIKQNEELELKNAKDINKTKRSLIEKHNLDKVLQVRALDNIKISGTLNKKQRQEKINSELEFIRHRKNNEFPIEEHTSNPIEYTLFQNYPNPFNPITNIKYSIKEQKLVILKIYDILGREVKTLVNEVKTPGEYLVEFNGSELSSGIYFYRIVVGDFTAVKRMVLIK